MNYYQIVIDANGEVLETKNMGAAPAVTRTVAVIAESGADARKKAKILLGQHQ